MNEIQLAVIKDSIDMIDEKIKDDLVLDQLSKEIDMSKYHLHRMFNSITGKSLIHYVRRRKLSLSAIELLNTDLKVIDIANEYGYEQEQSYIRAFKQMFDITPAKFRKEKCELPIEQKIDLTLQNLYRDGFVVRSRMCRKPKFYLPIKPLTTSI